MFEIERAYDKTFVRVVPLAFRNVRFKPIRSDFVMGHVRAGNKLGFTVHLTGKKMKEKKYIFQFTIKFGSK